MMRISACKQRVGGKYSAVTRPHAYPEPGRVSSLGVDKRDLHLRQIAFTLAFDDHMLDQDARGQPNVQQCASGCLPRCYVSR